MPTSARPEAQKVFEYTSLDAETSQFVQQQTGEIRTLMRRTAQGIVEVGQKLIEVKEKLGHGRFLDWLEAEFEWTHETARRFMTVAQQFGQSPHVVEFALTALYILAAPSLPEAAREEAIARAKAGEPITYTVAKEIKKRYALPAKKSKSGPKLEPTLELELEAETVSPPKPLQTPPLPLSGTKLEIIAIRPQAQVLEIATTVVVPQVPQTPLVTQRAQPIDAIEQPGIWWQLGKHYLYCGDPNSLEFLARITEEVLLLLVFPPRPDWYSVIRATVHIVSSKYLPQGKTLDQLDEFLEASILFNTRLGELVISCFLPSPEILLIVNRLERHGLFAEPDERRCKAVISDWKRAGLKVEQVT